jgi:hypothetical protein
MKVAIIAVLLSMISGVPALAATFVYVSNAEDGDIGMYVRCTRDRASRRKSSSCQWP